MDIAKQIDKGIADIAREQAGGFDRLMQHSVELAHRLKAQGDEQQADMALVMMIRGLADMYLDAYAKALASPEAMKAIAGRKVKTTEETKVVLKDAEIPLSDMDAVEVIKDKLRNSDFFYKRLDAFVDRTLTIDRLKRKSSDKRTMGNLPDKRHLSAAEALANLTSGAS